MKINEKKFKVYNQRPMSKEAVLSRINIDKKHLDEKPNWHEIKNIIYYFKTRYDTRLITELLAHAYGEVQGLKMAEYVPAIVNDKIGLLSKNFQELDKFYYDIEYIYHSLMYRPKAASKVSKSDYYSLKSILENYKLKLDDNLFENLKEELVSLYIYDWFIHHEDRNPKNIMLAESSKPLAVNLAPIFDSEVSFGRDKKLGFKDITKDVWVPSMPYDLDLKPGEIDGIDVNMLGVIMDYPEVFEKKVDSLLSSEYYTIIEKHQNSDNPVCLSQEEAHLLKNYTESAQEKAYAMKKAL